MNLGREDSDCRDAEALVRDILRMMGAIVHDSDFAQQLVRMHAIGDCAAAIGLRDLQQLRITGPRHHVDTAQLIVAPRPEFLDELPEDAAVDHHTPVGCLKMKATHRCDCREPRGSRAKWRIDGSHHVAFVLRHRWCRRED